MFPKLSAEAWALAGVLVAGVGAFIRERVKARESPYDAMASRLQIIEQRASRVPQLEAKIWFFQVWGEQMEEWATSVQRACETAGISVSPPPRLPTELATPIDRRRGADTFRPEEDRRDKGKPRE